MSCTQYNIYFSICKMLIFHTLVCLKRILLMCLSIFGYCNRLEYAALTINHEQTYATHDNTSDLLYGNSFFVQKETYKQQRDCKAKICS